MNKIKSLKAKYDELERDLKNSTAEDLLAAFAEVFDENPSVVAVTWTQYTPHYNDGEPCTFQTLLEYTEAEDLCRTRLPRSEDLNPDSWDRRAGAFPEPDDVPYAEAFDYFEESSVSKPPAKKHGKALLTFVRGLPEEILEHVLGDGVRVFVWRGGIMTQEYDHD